MAASGHVDPPVSGTALTPVESPEHTTTDAVPAVVVGVGVTALGVLRALGRSGIPSYLMAPPDDIAHKSRWARPLPRAIARDRPLAEALGACALDAGVVIPTSDAGARATAALPDRLTDRFPASLSSLAVINLLTDKLAFAEFLRERGMPHPRTLDPEVPGALEAADDDMMTRAFLKPRDSQRFFRRFGVKALHVRSREEAARRAAELRDEGVSMVLQEYIPGPPTAHLFLDGFVDADGELRMLLARRRVRMYPRDFGNSTLCETVSATDVAPAVEALSRLLDAVSYRGIFSAEMKQDARTGEYRFLEINPRAWWYVEFAARCGVNVCEAAYRDALGQTFEVGDVPAPGQRLLYPEYDFSLFRQLRRERTQGDRGPSTGAWFRPWIGARQALFVADDPWPALWSAGRVLRRRFHPDRRQRH